MGIDSVSDTYAHRPFGSILYPVEHTHEVRVGLGEELAGQVTHPKVLNENI
jgi:hypothetical protein